MTHSSTQFDFKKVGKRMPYRVPDGYFNEANPITLKKRWIWAVAACVIVILSIYPILQWIYTPMQDQTLIYTQLSESENDWDDFAEADIFLDNINW